MAFSLARVAGAGLRRSMAPVVCSASTSGIFGRTSCRPSLRVSDVPFQKIADYFEGWNAEELIWARNIIDSKLEKKGLAAISIGRDARIEAMVRTMSKQVARQQVDISEIKNKKGDLAAINIGKSGTLNVLSVMTLLLKVEETWPMIPVIKAWIEKFQG